MFDYTPFDLVSLDEIVAKKEVRDPRKTPQWLFHYVDIASVSNKTFQIKNGKQLVGADAPSRARKVIRNNDVIISTTRPYLKSIAMIPTQLDGQICSTGFCVLRPTEKVLSDWLFYCAISDDLLRQITPKMRGANYPAVTDKDILSSKIPLPPLAEQRRIVACIKECMERVEEIEGLREYQEYDIALLQDAILDSMCNDEWPVRLLSDLLIDIRNGWSGKQHPSVPEVGVLRLSCVHSKSIDLQDVKVARIAPEVAARFHLKKDDVFIVRGNGSQSLVGRSAISEKDSTNVIFNDLLIRLRFCADVMPSFANYLFHTKKIRRQIIDAAKTAAGIWKINQKGLSRLQFPCPGIDVQSTFVHEAATVLEYCSQLAHNIKISDIQHLRESILHKAFAGEL